MHKDSRYSDGVENGRLAYTPRSLFAKSEVSHRKERNVRCGRHRRQTDEKAMSANAAIYMHLGRRHQKMAERRRREHREVKSPNGVDESIGQSQNCPKT